VPNGHILAGFAIGALYLAITTTHHLRALHKTKTCSPGRIFISCQLRLKKPIYYNLVSMVALLSLRWQEIKILSEKQVLVLCSVFELRVAIVAK
jgi:hypothetical protein